MGDKTNIEWTGATWNPIRARLRNGQGNIGWHCEHLSPGCVNCYAEGINQGAWPPGIGTGLPYKPGHRGDVEIYLDERILTQPLRWTKPRMIFPCSMTDIFGEFVPTEMIDQMFAVMALTPRHTYQVLTKRSPRMVDYCDRITCATGAGSIANVIDRLRPNEGLAHDWMIQQAELSHLPNAWLGVSVEDQQRARERIPDLLETPAAKRWLSCEPLLGPLDLNNLGVRSECDHEDAYNEWDTNALVCSECEEERLLDWVVAGGESGKLARGSTQKVESWMRSLRDQCSSAGVAFFGKQNFKKLPLPEDLMVREYPNG